MLLSSSEVSIRSAGVSAGSSPAGLSSTWPLGAVTRTRGAFAAPSRRIERLGSPCLIVTANEPETCAALACTAAALPSKTPRILEARPAAPDAGREDLERTEQHAAAHRDRRLEGVPPKASRLKQAPTPRLESRVVAVRQAHSRKHASMSWPKLNFPFLRLNSPLVRPVSVTGPKS